MTPAMSTPVDKKTRTGRALSANPSQPLSDSVTDQLAAIPDLSRNGLIERWTQAYSRPPPRGLSRRLLEYAAAYQIQARAFRGLPPAVRRRLQRIAAAGDSRVTAPARGGAAPALAPGSRLIREWRGRTRLCGLPLPPRGFRFHDPGRGFHDRRRAWRQVDLRGAVRGRELHARPRPAGPSLNGQCRAGHQWLAILHYHCANALAGRQACRLRPCRRGHGGRPQDRAVPQQRRRNHGVRATGVGPAPPLVRLTADVESTLLRNRSARRPRAWRSGRGRGQKIPRDVEPIDHRQFLLQERGDIRAHAPGIAPLRAPPGELFQPVLGAHGGACLPGLASRGYS